MRESIRDLQTVDGHGSRRRTVVHLLEIIAYHKSGHALVAESLPLVDRVHRISIMPRGITALGYTLQLPTQDRYLITRSELLDRLTVLMGGRTAEELAFQEISTGAQDDLARATDIARSMVVQYGMSATCPGPVRHLRSIALACRAVTDALEKPSRSSGAPPLPM